jgi:hypothetical protein
MTAFRASLAWQLFRIDSADADSSSEVPSNSNQTPDFDDDCTPGAVINRAIDVIELQGLANTQPWQTSSLPV